MFEQIGRVIDSVIDDFCVMMRRTRLYRRVYATCWVSVYFWLHPDKMTKETLDVLYACDYLTNKQYVRYWDKLEKKWGEQYGSINQNSSDNQRRSSEKAY